jgi:hypothetical protein
MLLDSSNKYTNQKRHTSSCSWGLRTRVGEVERKTEAAFYNEWEDTAREIEGDDALSFWTKRLTGKERERDNKKLN